jgi:two-component system cell cycle sensor histidine kinase/response regulator CckA
VTKNNPEEKGKGTEATPSQGSVFASIKGYASRRKAMPRRPLRILIVDDEEPIRRFVDRVLRDAGYVTFTAAGGVEALALAQKEEAFDVVVTDLMMPGLSGDELARRLRQDEPRLKVLYLTGYSDRLFMEKVTLWQDESFLEKPCSVKGLREAVALLFFGRLEAPPNG